MSGTGVVAVGQALATLFSINQAEIVVPFEDEDLYWFHVPGFTPGDEPGSVVSVSTRVAGRESIWPGRVVTEVEPVGDFWEAEPEHQDYLERYPHGYTCHYPRPDWVLPKRAAG